MSQHLIDTGLIDTELRLTAQHDARHDPSAHAGGRAQHRQPSDSQGESPAPSRDATLDALDALGGALEQLAKDVALLEDRLKVLRREREAGRPWREILAAEGPPGTMQVVSRMLACLASASGTLRKELVDSLRREEVSIPAIAKLFGVTHQRVSNLLRRPVE